MKIVVISPAHPLRGGIAASSERLAQELQAQGHEVVVYSFALQYPAFLFPGKTQVSDDPPPTGLKIVTLLNSVNPFNWLKSGLLLAAEQPDRVIVRFWLPFMGPCLGTVLRILRWRARKKAVVTALVDNMIPHEKRVGDRLFSKYFIAACHDFVVMSKSVGTDILGFLPSDTSDTRVRFAPHPIYDIYGAASAPAAARRKLGLNENVPLLLFFGLIRPYKGLDVLLQAMAEPAMQTHNIHLLVAGECYGDEAFYLNMIEQSGIAERVHLHLKYISNDEVATYFSAADLVVQPYKTATQSGVLQIAYHFRRPVVVTRVGGLPEMVEEGQSGFVVPPQDPQAIAQVVCDFFEQGKMPAMQAGIEQILPKYTWSNLVNSLLSTWR